MTKYRSPNKMSKKELKALVFAYSWESLNLAQDSVVWAELYKIDSVEDAKKILKEFSNAAYEMANMAHCFLKEGEKLKKDSW